MSVIVHLIIKNTFYVMHDNNYECNVKVIGSIVTILINNKHALICGYRKKNRMKHIIKSYLHILVL